MRKLGLGLVAIGYVLVSMVAVSIAQAQTTNDAAVKRGKMLWTNRGCGGCHAVGKKMAGPDLMGVEQRRTREWLNRWFANTDDMLVSDSIGKALLAEWNGIRMPTQKLSEQDVEAILSYVRAEEAQAKSKGR